MRDGHVVDLSALRCTERLELIRIKVGAVICDDVVRNSVSEYQLSDETAGSACSKVFDGLGFDPLGKLVDCYKQMGEATRARLEGSVVVLRLTVEWGVGMERQDPSYGGVVHIGVL